MGSGTSPDRYRHFPAMTHTLTLSDQLRSKQSIKNLKVFQLTKSVFRLIMFYFYQYDKRPPPKKKQQQQQKPNQPNNNKNQKLKSEQDKQTNKTKLK